MEYSSGRQEIYKKSAERLSTYVGHGSSFSNSQFASRYPRTSGNWGDPDLFSNDQLPLVNRYPSLPGNLGYLQLSSNEWYFVNNTHKALNSSNEHLAQHLIDGLMRYCGMGDNAKDALVSRHYSLSYHPAFQRLIPLIASFTEKNVCISWGMIG